MRPRHCTALIVVLAAGGLCTRLHAQMPQAPQNPYNASSRSMGSPAHPEGGIDDDLPPGFAERRREQMKNYRRKRLADDAARLLLLTRQYHASVDAGTMPDTDQARALDEIGKLARTIRDEMKE